jgi:hypothetical protein
MKPAETAVVRERLCKHVLCKATATHACNNTRAIAKQLSHATEEELLGAQRGPNYLIPTSVCIRLYNKIMQATSRGHTKS